MSKNSIKKYILKYLSEDDEVSWKYKWVGVGLQLLIVMNVVAVILETFDHIDQVYGHYFDLFEDVTVIVFIIEFVLRVYISDITHPTSSRFKSAYKLISSASGLIDIIAIVPFFVPFFISIDLRHVRILRLVRLLRVFKFQKYNQSVRIIVNILNEKKIELLGTLVIAVSIIIVASTLMYYVEKEAQPQNFPNILNAFWWGIITLTTIGYGDIVPITPYGKLIGSTVALTGVLLMAIPLGIISTGFVKKLDEQSRKRRLNYIKGIIKDAFYKKYFPLLECEIQRGALSIEAIRINLEISDEEIVKIAEGKNEYRYRRLLLPVNGVLTQKLCVEYRETNTNFGIVTKRESDILCISADSYNKQSIGYFTYCLSESLKASYISNEFYGSDAEFIDETFGDKGLEPDSTYNFIKNAYYSKKEKSNIPSAFSKWIYHVRSISRVSKIIVVTDKHRNNTNDDHYIHLCLLGNKADSILSDWGPKLVRECAQLDHKKLNIDTHYVIDENHLAHYVHKSYPEHLIVYVSLPLNLLCYQLFETASVMKKSLLALQEISK